MDADAALPMSASHPLLPAAESDPGGKRFDQYVEAICEDFYTGEVGGPGLLPGIISGC